MGHSRFGNGVMSVRRRLLNAGLLVMGLLGSAAHAQERNTLPSAQTLLQYQGQIEVFSALLSADLGLNEPGGLFNMGVGSVRSRYLLGQGVSFEVRHPLANSRQRLGLATLGTTMRALQASQNPFAALSNRADAAMRRTSPSADSSRISSELEASLASTMQGVDYQLIIGTALRQASEVAESLRSLDGLDSEGYATLRAEIAGYQSELQVGLTDLRAGDSARILALRTMAQERVEALRQQLSIAQEDYEQRWLAERDALSATLLRSVCTGAGELALLPEGESLAFVLQGLGNEESSARRDQILVVQIAEARRCASGELDVSEFMSLSAIYSY